MSLAPTELMRSTSAKSDATKHTVHPEMQRRKAKSRVPGDESSKVRRPGRDVRQAHDKDGNEQQLRHKSAK